jgi:hypothetical protein
MAGISMNRIIIRILQGLLFSHIALVSAEQSISIEWSKSEAYYAGQNRNFFYQPNTTSLYYSLALNEAWSMGASLWRSEASEYSDMDRWRLKEEGSGAALNINYLNGNWSTNLGLSISETDLDIRSLGLPDFYKEQGETRDLNLSLAYLFSFDRLDISPSFGLGSQQFKIDSSGAIPPFTFSRDEEQTSSYAFSDLVLSTWFELSQASLVQPSIQFGWTEALSGASSFTVTKAGSAGLSRTNSSASNTKSDGSGYMGMSLSLFIDDFQLRFSHSKTFALDINSETSSVELGIVF